MDELFVKATELVLVNGGYVVTGEANTPVGNKDFQIAQLNAEYVVTFAKLAKDKDFVGKKADSLTALKAEVFKVLDNQAITYVKAPKKATQKLTEQLKLEALNFMQNAEDTEKANRVNEFMQQFNIIQEFEEFGLYFKPEITKLDKIYTKKEIVKAVEEVIDLLDL